MAEQDYEYRPLNEKEIAFIVRCRRDQLGWSQETLAELAKVNTRSVQRMESGEATALHTRQAVARALEMDDPEVFTTPHRIPTPDKIRRDAEEAKRSTVQLPATVIESGRHLMVVACRASASTMSVPETIPREAELTVAAIFDLMRDFTDIEQEYSATDRLGIQDTFDGLLADLHGLGWSLCIAVRDTKIVGKSWPDQTPRPWRLVYFTAAPKGEEPKILAVSKQISMA